MKNGSERPLVLLDFDGTLAATEPIGYANLTAVMAEMTGLDPAVIHPQLMRHHGRTLPTYHHELLEVLGVSAAQMPLQELLDRHNQRLFPRFRAGVPPAAHLAEGLTRLATRAELRLATNSEADRVEAAVTGMDEAQPGLAKTLEQCLSALHSARRSKPDPEVYLTAMESAGATGPVVMVEDSSTGLRAAHEAKRQRQPAGPTLILGVAGLHGEPQAHGAALAALGLADQIIIEDDWRLVATTILQWLDDEGPR